MREPIILLAKIRYSDGVNVRVIGVSDAPYFGEAIGMDGGIWWPLLDPESDQGWGESARHTWQGQSDPFSVGELTLINTGRHFDGWTRHSIAGLVTEVQRGPASAVWNEEPDRFDVFHPGKMEPVWRAQGRTRRFEGRERLILSFESLLAPLAGALNSEVFDEETANETLINRPVPLVLGNVFQVRPALVEPNILAYVSAANLAVTHSVAEGGNPNTPVWIALPQGHQLLQSPTLAITADIAGPPLGDTGTAEDVLAGMGDFDQWDGGDLDIEGLAVTKSDGVALTEGAGGDTMLVDIDPDGQLETDWLTCNAVDQRAYQGVSRGTPWEPITGTDITPEMLQSDDSAGARVFPIDSVRRSWRLIAKDLEVDIPDASIVTGLACRFRADKVGGNSAAIHDAGVFFSDGTLARTAELIGAFEPLTETKETYTYGGDGDLFGRPAISGAQVNHPDFGAFISTSHDGELPSAARVFLVEFKAWYTVELRRATFTWAGVLEPGERYTIEVEALDEDGSVRLDWSESVDPTDPFSARSAIVSGAGELRFVFTAGDPDFVLKIFRAGNGQQEINHIRLRQSSGAQDTLDQLVPWVVNHMGLDPEQHVVQAMIDAHANATGMARLGWLVANSETADDILALLAGSLGGMLWHDRGGRVKSMLLLPPDDSDDDILHIDDNRIDGDIEIFDDDPEGMTDRAAAATNWHPIPEDRAAGVLSEQEKANVAARHRVVRRVKFPDLEGFEPAEPPDPGLSVDAIDPNSGPEAGGTAVTITGTGFEEGATVTIGGSAATEVAVVSDTEITCVTPAGDEGAADITVTNPDESFATLAGGFEYEGAVSDLPVTDGLIARFNAFDLSLDDADPVTLWPDTSGNDHDADDNTGITYVANALNGNPAVHVGAANGHEMRFTNAISVPGSTSLTAVYIMVPLAWHGNNSGIWRSSSSGSNSSGNDFHIFNGSNRRPWMRWSGTDVLRATTGDQLTASTPVVSTWLIENDEKAEHWIDGVLAQATTHSRDAAAFSVHAIGWQSTNNERFEAYYGEILFYDRPLTSAEIGEIQDYAESVWGF